AIYTQIRRHVSSYIWLYSFSHPLLNVFFLRKYSTMDARCFFIIFLVLLIEVARCENEVENIEDSESGERELRQWPWGRRQRFVCPSRFGTYADIFDCSSFYICARGKANRRNCNSGTQFDKYRKTCLSSTIAVCDKGGEKDKRTAFPVTKNDGGATSKDEFTCESLHGIFPDPDDCSKYYKCSFYLKSRQTCPNSQLFDSYKKGCRRGEDVNCGSRKRPNGDVDLTTTTTILPTTKKVEKDEFTCESLHGIFPDPDDCSKYYKCTFYIKSLQTCPNSELFDSYKKGCRRGKDVNCGSRKNPNGDDDLTTVLPTTKKEEKDVDDTTTALPTTKKEEKGDDDPTTTPPTTKKDEKDQFTCPSVYGKFPHPDDCSKYYFCTFFLKSLQTCPNSELFDSDKKECRRGEDVHCGSRKRPNGYDDPTTTLPTTKKDLKDATTEKITTTPIPTETPTPTVPEKTTPTPTEPEPETTTPTPTEPEPETTTPTPTEPEPETTTPTPTEPEPETTTPTEPEPETTTPTEPEPETTTPTEPEPETTTPTEPEPETTTPTEPEPETTTPTEPEPETTTPTEPEPETTTPTEPEPETTTPTEPEPETTTPTEPEPETTTPTPTEPEPETTTPTPTEPEPETTTPTPTEPEPETTTPTPTEPEPETTTPTPAEPEPETTTTTPTEPEPTTTTTTEEPTTTKRPEVTVPDTDCDEDDVDCIIDKLGRKPKWFLCPENIGSFPHPKSKKLFIFCLNWKPSVKKCGKNLVFSEDLKTCAH
ncbi:unnamed protein product, partial [Larinioides sclopetarius]